MKFTDTHEWVEINGDGNGVIGVTHHAQKELGDVVYVELPEVGKTIRAGDEVVVLESTKAAADIYSPISGIITAVNGNLLANPELINHSPEKEGWIYKIKPSNVSELDTLMDKEAYQALLN